MDPIRVRNRSAGLRADTITPSVGASRTCDTALPSDIHDLCRRPGPSDGGQTGEIW